MRIAMITETFLPSTDGIVTRLTAAIRWLRGQGHDILVIAPDLGVHEYYGARVEGIPARHFFLYKDKQLAFPHPKVRQLLKAYDPDLVHVVNPAVLGVAGIFYGRKWPLIASYHTNIPQYAYYYKLPFLKPILWWFFRTLHNRADLNLCTSSSVQTELASQRFKNVHVWKRGVALEQFGSQHHNAAMRNRLTDGQSGQRLLLYVGRLAAEKGIEQIRDVLEASDDFSLAIVGDGPHRQELEEHFKGTRTLFTGFLHGAELSQAYASSDMFVFPSTTETNGLVILEAMASGLPIVAAKSGPICEQIEHGKTGLLYDASESTSFIEAVLSLSNDDELRMQMQAEARKAAEAFGWDMPSEQLLTFYQDVLGQASWHARLTEAHDGQNTK